MEQHMLCDSLTNSHCSATAQYIERFIRKCAPTTLPPVKCSNLKQNMLCESVRHHWQLLTSAGVFRGQCFARSSVINSPYIAWGRYTVIHKRNSSENVHLVQRRLPKSVRICMCFQNGIDRSPATGDIVPWDHLRIHESIDLQQREWQLSSPNWAFDFLTLSKGSVKNETAIDRRD